MGKTKTLYQGRRLIAGLLKATAITAGIGIVLVAPNAISAMDMFVKRYDKRRGSRTSDYLKRAGYFEIKANNDGRFVIKLTEKGKKRLKNVELEFFDPLPRRHKWDGKWHIIMFDIAEKHKTSRDYISRRIQEMNLAPIQDSVYAYPYTLEELASVIRAHYPHLASYIISMRADRIDGEKQLKKHFINIL